MYRRITLPGRLWLLTPLALAATLSLSAHAMRHGGDRDSKPHVAEDTDRLIVKYRNRTTADVMDAATLQSAEKAAGKSDLLVKHLRRTGSGSHVLRLDKRLSLDKARQLAAEIKASDPMVEYAEPDRVMTIQIVPNDPSYSSQWHYQSNPGGLNLPAAWDQTTGTGVTVAVIDTGYRPHADLAANIVPGYDFITSTVVANDKSGRDASALDPGDWVKAGECSAGSPAQNSSWHGTHTAGTVAAITRNGVGVAGVAYGAKVQPIRVLGKCGGFTSDIADAIIWASGGTVPGVPANATPARVINLSLGGPGACDATSQNAINSARSRNSVVVVSAGNSNANAAGFSPASCTGVITVGAVGPSGARAFYSNYGPIVDVSAPGGDQSQGDTNGVYSTLNAGTKAPGADSYAWYQGTSMAAPHVAGVVALMLARNPALTPDDIDVRLKASARPLPVACAQGCGVGIVDALAAVNAAVGAAPPPPPPPPPAPAPPPGSVATEPNESIAAAQSITWPASVSGSFTTSTDADYFRISIPAGKSVVATMAPNATSDYDLYGYNDAGVRTVTSSAGTGQVDTVTIAN
ncbi:MAG: hypothetical protein RL375_281, partial [Pseudomonadota bacterium]